MNQLILREENFSKLKNIINKYSESKIFLVVGNASFLKSGAKDFLHKSLDLDIKIGFSGFAPNPQIEDLLKGISLFNQGNMSWL